MKKIILFYLISVCTALIAGEQTNKDIFPVQVCLDNDRVMLLDNHGAIWSWGGSNGNSQGQMGLGDDVELNFLAGYNGSGGAWHFGAQKVDDGYRSIACANDHSAGIKKDGTLWVWGRGYMGDGAQDAYNLMPHFKPLCVGRDYERVALGYEYTLAIKKDGTLWAWGDNQYGQLGDGTKEKRFSPIKIGNDFQTIAAGNYHSAGIKKDGTLWMWGSNQKGQFGLGNIGENNISEEYLTPVKVGEDYQSISVEGSSSVGVMQNGDLMISGYGMHGLGRGIEYDSSSIPVKIGSDYTNVVASSHFLGLKRDGTVWEWGYRPEGEAYLTPVMVATHFSSIAIGRYESGGIKKDNTLWLWDSDNWQYLVDNGYGDSFHDRDKRKLLEPTRINFPLKKQVKEY